MFTKTDDLDAAFYGALKEIAERPGRRPIQGHRRDETAPYLTSSPPSATVTRRAGSESSHLPDATSGSMAVQ